jgi:Arylsulfotransferase (ASST)
LVRTTLMLRLSIAIAAACACALVLTATAGAAAPIAAYTTKGAWTFVSAPKLHPPKLSTNGTPQTKKLAPGYFMAANFKILAINKPMVGEAGPLILDRNLQPVWFFPVGTNQFASNLEAQTYNGKPVLSWWQGVVTGTGDTTSGEDVVVDQHYRTLATLKGANGWIISEHELIISGANAWVTAYKNVPMNLKPYGGSANGVVVDTAVQEYNLKTGQLLYTWDALNPGGTPNVPLSQSQQKAFPGIPWDAYHLNSIQLTGHGTFLVSLRNTWSAYLVNRTTNGIEWTLSGNPSLSTFRLPAAAQFHWQHDVQMHKGNVVSVFDDACCAITGVSASGKVEYGAKSGPTRGLVLKLNPTAHTGSLIGQYVRTKNESFDTVYLGNTDLLPDGNVAVGWGSQPFFSEYSKSGQLLLSADWPIPDISYRTYVQNWVGIPYFAPSGAVRTSHGKTTVYASWDGSTQVVSWRVLGGPDARHLKAVATKAKNGFETAIALGSAYKTYEVQALDAKGHVLRTSGSFSAAKTNTNSNSGLPQAY